MAVGLGVGVTVGIASTVASSFAVMVASTSGVDISVTVGIAASTAAFTVAYMSGVGVGVAPNARARLATAMICGLRGGRTDGPLMTEIPYVIDNEPHRRTRPQRPEGERASTNLPMWR